VDPRTGQEEMKRRQILLLQRLELRPLSRRALGQLPRSVLCLRKMKSLTRVTIMLMYHVIL
jgi:hypothetical protein